MRSIVRVRNWRRGRRIYGIIRIVSLRIRLGVGMTVGLWVSGATYWCTRNRTVLVRIWVLVLGLIRRWAVLARVFKLVANLAASIFKLPNTLAKTAG